MTPQDHAAFFDAVASSSICPDNLGLAFELCQRATQQQASAYAAAHSSGDLEAFFRKSLEGARKIAEREARSAVLTDATDEGLGHHEYVPGSTDLNEKADLARRAWRQAHSSAKGRMSAYLGWFERQQAGETAAAIAESLDMPAATVRTGLARAKRRIVELTNQLRYSGLARKASEMPAHLEAAVEAYKKRDLPAMKAVLDDHRPGDEGCSHWSLLMAWYHNRREEYGAAETALNQALLVADVPTVRAKVLNSLGNLKDTTGDLKRAVTYWRRAHRLDENAPVPLLNLLANASERKDLADCSYYVSELAQLRSRKTLDDSEQAFVLGRLQDNPEFDWVRRTAVWRRGPMRWLQALVLVLAVFTMGLGACDEGSFETPLAPTTQTLMTVEFMGAPLGATEALRPTALEFLDSDGDVVEVVVLELELGEAGQLVAEVTLDGEAIAAVAEFASEVRVLSREGVTSIEVLRWAEDESVVAVGDVAWLEFSSEQSDARKDEYIRPSDEPAASGGTASKDEYIRPTIDGPSLGTVGATQRPSDSVSKDEYIRPEEGTEQTRKPSGSVLKDEYIRPETTGLLGTGYDAHGESVAKDEYIRPKNDGSQASDPNETVSKDEYITEGTE